MPISARSASSALTEMSPDYLPNSISHQPHQHGGKIVAILQQQRLQPMCPTTCRYNISDLSSTIFTSITQISLYAHHFLSTLRHSSLLIWYEDWSANEVYVVPLVVEATIDNSILSASTCSSSDWSELMLQEMRGSHRLTILANIWNFCSFYEAW